MPGFDRNAAARDAALARASRFGVWAVSSSVLPPGLSGRPPRPSATSITILLSLRTTSSRVSSCMSIGLFLASLWLFFGGGPHYRPPRAGLSNGPDNTAACCRAAASASHAGKRPGILHAGSLAGLFRSLSRRMHAAISLPRFELENPAGNAGRVCPAHATPATTWTKRGWP